MIRSRSVCVNVRDLWLAFGTYEEKEEKAMSWEITGNSGTNSSVNFLGTTDSQPLVVKVNGVEAMRIDSTGVDVAGDIRLTNADCAEDFNIGGEPAESGTVMVLGEGGVLFPSRHAHDKRVAGVISGAGGYKPGIMLDKQQSRDFGRTGQSGQVLRRQPIALLGKVYCKVDANYAPVEAGDLLTTSDTVGHAMKALDPFKAFGSVLGKALCGMKEGKGLIPILVTLQ